MAYYVRTVDSLAARLEALSQTKEKTNYPLKRLKKNSSKRRRFSSDSIEEEEEIFKITIGEDFKLEATNSGSQNHVDHADQAEQDDLDPTLSTGTKDHSKSESVFGSSLGRRAAGRVLDKGLGELDVYEFDNIVDMKVKLRAEYK